MQQAQAQPQNLRSVAAGKHLKKKKPPEGGSCSRSELISV